MWRGELLLLTATRLTPHHPCSHPGLRPRRITGSSYSLKKILQLDKCGRDRGFRAEQEGNYGS